MSNVQHNQVRETERLLEALVCGGGGRGDAVVRKSDSQSREPTFASSCCRFEAWTISFTPRCINSLSYINEYLDTDRGGYVNECSPRSNCSVAVWYPEKSSRCWNEHDCKG